jgi:hypothetical protein
VSAPAFTADASSYVTSRQYHTPGITARSGAGGVVTPAQLGSCNMFCYRYCTRAEHTQEGTIEHHWCMSDCQDAICPAPSPAPGLRTVLKPPT